MKVFFLYTIVLLSFGSYGQNVMKIKDAERKYRQDSLQEVYFNRIFSDEISTCFQASPELFMVEWSKFSRAVSKYAHSQNFIWGKKTIAQVEVYFDQEEKIDHFFVYVRDPEFSEERYSQLMDLLREFAKEYKFTLDAAIPFSNSGSITFYD